MPPHCDSLDGPVVRAAAEALDQGRVELVLPFVPADGESELRTAFERAIHARTSGGDARYVADRWFFETAVRVHRAGEGAPFTGLKPGGLDVGPVIPIAERAIETGDPTALANLLADAVRSEVYRRFEEMQSARAAADREESVASERAYVATMLGLEVWAHRVHRGVIGPSRSKDRDSGAG